MESPRDCKVLELAHSPLWTHTTCGPGSESATPLFELRRYILIEQRQRGKIEYLWVDQNGNLERITQFILRTGNGNENTMTLKQIGNVFAIFD